MSNHLTPNITASELRQALALGFQPGILARPDVLAETTANLAAWFVQAGVTERRLTTAFGIVSVPEAQQQDLLAEMGRLRLIASYEASVARQCEEQRTQAGVR